MKCSDQHKLLDAGFKIIRAEYYATRGEMVILCKSPKHRDWHFFETGFKTKVSIKNRMVELLKDSKTVDIDYSTQSL